MKKQMISAAELLLTAFIWGVAFVAQSVGMDYIGPFTFNCVRSVIGGLVLIPLILVLKKVNKEISYHLKLPYLHVEETKQTLHPYHN